MYGSVSSSRCKNYKMLMPKLEEDYSKLDPDFGDIRPGKVSHYLMHSIELNGCIKVHLLAVVEWFRKTNADLGYLHPITGWQSRLMACILHTDSEDTGKVCLDLKESWYSKFHRCVAITTPCVS